MEKDGEYSGEYDAERMVPIPLVHAERVAQQLREAFAEDGSLAGYGYPDGGVRIHIELDDDGRAHVGFVFELPAAELLTRLLEAGDLDDGPFDWL